MSREERACALVSDGGLPIVVRQALDDRTLSPASKAVMWELQKRLDFHHYREQKEASLAAAVGIEPQSVGRALRLLVERGYLDEHQRQRPRAYRMPWSRRVDVERAA